jgi:hypothetical protein
MANLLAYGFEVIAHLVDDRASIADAGVEVVWDAVVKSAQIQQEITDSMFALLCQKTTDYKRSYKTTKHASLEPLDPEVNRATPILVGGRYDVGFPIGASGIALAHTKEEFLEMTVQEANQRALAIQEAYQRYMRSRILSALFTNTEYTFKDLKYGDLTVKPLANSDAVTYFKNGGADEESTDTHFLGQAAAISDSANLLKTLSDELREHPENGGEVISFIPSGLETSVTALAGFNEARDPRMSYGSGVTTLNAAGPGVDFPGLLLGYEADSKSWVVRWDALPANYVISTCTQTEAPLMMRQHPLPQFQGFYLDYERENQPFWEAQWKVRCGFGAWNRVGAAVGLVGNASYSIPTGYTAPLPG